MLEREIMEDTERSSLVEQPTRSERLSDERLGNLISAVGNHEAKALLLGLMWPKIIYTQRELQTHANNAQGQNLGWVINDRTLFDYCKQSFSPIGLVAQEVTIRGTFKPVGYVKTDLGQREGDVLGGLLLDFSLRYPQFSLQDIFGGTVSNSKFQDIEGGAEYKKRSPITRLRIFWELVTSSLPIRTFDLAKSLGEQRNLIGNHLSSLSEKGVLSYESTLHGEPIIYFQLKEKRSPDSLKPHRKIYGARITLIQSAYQILEQNPGSQFTIESMAEEYLKIYPESNNLSRVVLLARLGRILSSFVKQGYAERGKFSNEKLSEIDLADEQRQMLLDLTTFLDQFQNQDPEIIAYGKKCMQEITVDPEKVSLLMRKAWDKSRNAQSIPQEQTVATMLTIISQNPGLTTNQIREIIPQYQNITMVTTRINSLVRFLLKTGQITQETVRGVRHFSITTPPKHSETEIS